MMFGYATRETRELGRRCPSRWLTAWLTGSPRFAAAT